jgi:hypothetical protein
MESVMIFMIAHANAADSSHRWESVDTKSKADIDNQK